MTPTRWIKAGAAAYVLWGVLHILISIGAIAMYATGGAVSMLGIYGSGMEAALITDPGALATNITLHHSINLGVFGLLGIMVSVMLLWKENRTGYWLNLVLLGITDTAFVILLVVPGLIALQDALLGPALYILGVAFTTIGFFAPSRASAAAAITA